MLEASCDLSACIGAPGPRDFAVRRSTIRRAKKLRLTPLRPSHPAPYVRDDREPPLLWARDGRKHRGDLPDKAMRGACDKLARRADYAGPVCGARRSSFRGALRGANLKSIWPRHKLPNGFRACAFGASWND